MRNKKDIASHEAKRPAVPDIRKLWEFESWCERFVSYVLRAKARDPWDKISVEFCRDWDEPQWTVSVTSERQQYNPESEVQCTWRRRTWERMPFSSTVEEVVAKVDRLILDNRDAFRNIAKKPETP